MPPRTARSSAPPTPTSASGGFALSGPSNPPDPHFHAYRKDLADRALAGRVIASHYAEPVERRFLAETQLREGASDQAASIREVRAGEPFRLLDDTLGWAWGYAGDEGRVGYVRSEALGN